MFCHMYRTRTILIDLAHSVLNKFAAQITADDKFVNIFFMLHLKQGDVDQ